MARCHHNPPTVRFYQLAGAGLEEALRRLAGKAVERGLRVCIITGGGPWESRLDDYLWREPVGGFLPHGRSVDPQPHRQPVLLSPQPEDVNQASVAMVTNGRVLECWDRFDMVIDFADVNNPDALRASRVRYRYYQQLGCAMEYWMQGAEGWKKLSST